VPEAKGGILDVWSANRKLSSDYAAKSFHEKAGECQVFPFVFFLFFVFSFFKLFPMSQAASVATLPSELFASPDDRRLTNSCVVAKSDKYPATFASDSTSTSSVNRDLRITSGLLETRDKTREKRRSGVPGTARPDRRTVKKRPNRIRSTQSNSGKQNS